MLFIAAEDCKKIEGSGVSDLRAYAALGGYMAEVEIQVGQINELTRIERVQKAKYLVKIVVVVKDAFSHL